MSTRAPVLISVLALGLGGCAPVYAPAAFQVAMLEEEGDLHLSGQLGLEGAELHGSGAISDHVAVRAVGQHFWGEDTRYDLCALGLGLYGATGEEVGWRWSLSGEVGLAPAVGTLSTESGGTTRFSGTGLRTAVQLDGGLEVPYGAVGIALRPVVYHFTHDERSDDAGNTATWTLGEAAVVARLGTRPLKVEAQGGLWLPLAGAGNIGVPLPLMLSFGLIYDGRFAPGTGGADR
ncbi:MAG: hypothetical protein JXX28_03505 [Deltaproteobacteria bacterium]|nr:hypothetical protein [Deltaproteobacteria bacterium]